MKLNDKYLSDSYSDISIGMSTPTISAIIGVILRYVLFLIRDTSFLDNNSNDVDRRASLLAGLFVGVVGSGAAKRLARSIQIISNAVRLHTREGLLAENRFFKLILCVDEIFRDHRTIKKVDALTFANFFTEIRKVFNNFKVSKENVANFANFCEEIIYRYNNGHSGGAFYDFYANWLIARNYSDLSRKITSYRFSEKISDVPPFWMFLIMPESVFRYSQRNSSQMISFILNREIKNFLDVDEINSNICRTVFNQDFEFSNSKEITPFIPEQKIASVEVEWSKQEQLVIIEKELATFVPKDIFIDVLKSLKNNIISLSEELKGLNCDSRFISFLDKVSSKIDSADKDREMMFSFCHDYQALLYYADVIKEEYSPYISSRYHSMLIHFDNTIKQIPDWIEFKKNISFDKSPEIIEEEFHDIAKSFSDVLGNSQLSVITSPDIKISIDKQIKHYEEKENILKSNSGINNTRIFDLFNSIENILKKLSSKALEFIKNVAKSGADNFLEGFKNTTSSIANKAGAIAALSLISIPFMIYGSQIIAFFKANFPWFEKAFDFLIKYKDVIDIFKSL